MNAANARNIEDLRLLAQRYLPRVARDYLERGAFDAGYEALVVTTDVPVGANREYNLRDGFAIPFRINARNMLDGRTRAG